MEQQNTTTNTTNSNAGKGMGIAGLIVGIVALLFSFIPCLGMWAIVPAVVGLILSAISMKQAGAAGGSKGMAIGGLICSIVGLLIACYWLYVWFSAASAIGNAIEQSGALDSLNKAMEQLKESGALDSLNNAMQQIKEMTDSTQTH